MREVHCNGDSRHRLEANKIAVRSLRSVNALKLRAGEHDVDDSPTRVTDGGSLSATGAGGDRVWRDSLDPAVQRALKRFFE